MAVHVTETSGPLWTIVHDEAGHVGEADPSTLGYAYDIAGLPNPEIVLIPCPEPGCGIVSGWPRESLPPGVLEKVA